MRIYPLVICEFVKEVWGRLGIEAEERNGVVFGDWMARISERENLRRRVEVAMLGGVGGSKLFGIEATVRGTTCYRRNRFTPIGTSYSSLTI